MQSRIWQKGTLVMGVLMFCLVFAAIFSAVPVIAEQGIISPLDLNTAGPEDLAKLPGIGSVKADAIVSFRTANGPFASIDGLLDVPGIGPRLLDTVRDLVAVTSR